MAETLEQTQEGQMDLRLHLLRMRMRILSRFSRTKRREYAGLKHWFRCIKIKRTLANSHYHHFYTAHFGFDDQFYSGRRILDVGCGPRGSLEWADMAMERVGIDPLVDYYRHFGTRIHRMRYIKAHGERIPFADGYFDVVASFNSLDHVIDLEKTISDIKRVTRPGGWFLLLVNVGHAPNLREPHRLTWDTARLFAPPFKVLDEKHYETLDGDMYGSIKRNKPYDHADPRQRTGVLSVKMRKA